MRWPSQYNNNCIALEIQLLLMKVLYTERKVSVPRTKSFCTPNLAWLDEGTNGAVVVT